MPGRSGQTGATRHLRITHFRRGDRTWKRARSVGTRRSARRCPAARSRLAFTYVRKDFVDGRALYGEECIFQQYVGKTKTWLFGMYLDEVAHFFGRYG